MEENIKFNHENDKKKKHCKILKPRRLGMGSFSIRINFDLNGGRLPFQYFTLRSRHMILMQ